MADLQKVRVQLYDENDNLVGDVDVMTSAECVTFADGETFQQKLDSGKLKGATGATGAKGATGAAGAAATVAVGTVTTGAAGSNAGVTNAGTANAAILNFTIPRGATGAAGAKGDKGDIGAAGQRGTMLYPGTGITGTSTTATVFSGSGVASAMVNDMYINTSTGNLYQCTVGGAASVAKWVYKGTLKGPKGDTGAIGPQGPKGDTGAVGPQGVKGDTGAQGPAGAKGATGPAGAKGEKGDPGDSIRVGTDYNSAVQRKIFFKVVE